MELKRKINGWIFLDKPLGLSSTQALGRVKRLLKCAKAGHGGTLDPLASGLLPLALGEATKLISFVFDSEKTYEFTVQWGIETASSDREGEVVFTSSKRPSEAQIREALPHFEGILTQVPPLYSSVKVDGKRGYEWARAGKIREVPPRQVFVRSLEFLEGTQEEAHFRVSCGKGTYVRSLARDLGRFLGVFGFVTHLRRTKIGKFSLDCSISLDNLEKSANSMDGDSFIVPMETVLDDIPAVSLGEPFTTRLHHGQKILLTSEEGQECLRSLKECGIVSRVAFLGKGGNLLGIARFEEGFLIPERNFNRIDDEKG